MFEIRQGYSIALPHLHTLRSDGMVSPSQLVYDMAEFRDKTGVNVVGAITDHDTINGLAEAYKAASCRGIELIAGEEVSIGSWPSKHMLALFREEPQNRIEKGLSAETTIDKIKENGGIVIPAHPDGFGGFASLTSKEISRLENKELIDGIEVINGKYDRRWRLEPIVKHLNKKRPVARIAGPDSHYGKKDLLKSYTLFPGKTVDDFFKAVNEGTTKPVRGVKDSVKWTEKVVQFGYSNGVLNWRRYVRKDL